MEKYFHYPLSLMQLIKNDTDKEGLLKIIAYCVMSFSEKMSYQKNSVANQIIYLYYRRPYFLPNEIKTYLEEMFDDGRLIEDEDYHGFSDETFIPEQENEGMISEFESNDSFFLQCVTVYREHQTISLLKLNPELINDFRSYYQLTTKFIISFEDKNGPDAWTSVSNNILYDVFKGTVSMDYFRLITAVKSILGKLNFNETYKSVLLCRMFGCKKNAILNEFFIKNPDLKVKYDLLSRRRQWEKLINSAMKLKYISHYCTGRQFFVSIAMTEDELRNAVLQRKRNFGQNSINV